MSRRRNPAVPLLLVDTFAAHLAHLLNAGVPHAVILPSAIEEQALATLATPPYEKLIGMGVYEEGAAPEDVARRYFEAVLTRPLFLHGNHATHTAHALLLALCQRGLDPRWETARLDRKRGAGRPPGNASSAPRVEHARESIRVLAGRGPPDFPEVAERLARLDATISPGNPAASTRKAHGPLILAAGGARAEVPEELPFWDAVLSAPRRLRRLARGAEFNAFCSIVIKALRAANADFGPFVSVGLLRSEWPDMSIDKAKRLSAFLTDVREACGRGKESVGDLETWRRVWLSRHVPSFDSADDLWNSDIGRALRFPVRPAVETIDDSGADPAAPGDPEGEIIDRLSLDPLWVEARNDGAIDGFDLNVLRELAEGAELIDIEKRSQTKLHLRGRGMDIKAYIADLHDRLSRYAIKRERDAAKRGPSR